MCTPNYFVDVRYVKDVSELDNIPIQERVNILGRVLKGGGFRKFDTYIWSAVDGEWYLASDSIPQKPNIFTEMEQIEEKPFFVVRKEMAFLRPFIVQVERNERDVLVKYVKRCKLADGTVADFNVYGFMFEYAELCKRPDWKDYCQYGVHFKQYDADYMNLVAKAIDQMVDQGMSKESIIHSLKTLYPRHHTVNRNGYLINISSALQNGRVSSVEGHALIPAYRMLNWTSKFKDSKFTEVMMSLNIDPACQLEINAGNRVVEVINSTQIYQKLMQVDRDIYLTVWRPRLQICLDNFEFDEQFNCLVANCGIQCITELHGELAPHAAEVYLEAVSGYLPHTRVFLNQDGFGKFRVLAFGIKDGETIRVKAGFRYQSGLAEIELGLSGHPAYEQQLFWVR